MTCRVEVGQSCVRVCGRLPDRVPLGRLLTAGPEEILPLGARLEPGGQRLTVGSVRRLEASGAPSEVEIALVCGPASTVLAANVSDSHDRTTLQLSLALDGLADQLAAVRLTRDAYFLVAQGLQNVIREPVDWSFPSAGSGADSIGEHRGSRSGHRSGYTVSAVGVVVGSVVVLRFVRRVRSARKQGTPADRSSAVSARIRRGPLR